MNPARLSLTLLACTLATASALGGEAESPHTVSANVALTTDYVFRGISQTSEDPAIQGGFDYTYEPVGLYLGVWASNLEFVEAGASDDPSIEIDYYGGFRGGFANGISWDVGAVYYSYPGQNEDDLFGVDYDYWDVKGALGYTFADAALSPALGVSIFYSPDYFGSDGDSIYVAGSLDLSLPHGFVFGGDVGYDDVEGDEFTGAVGGYEYVHWRVGVAKTIAGVTLDLSYHDAEEEACFGGDICEGRVVFTVSALLNLL
jgi:uncharacterized protein (TIGR02001 family)